MKERARAIAVLAGGIGAAVAYVAIRCIERAQSGPIDPTLILAESHVAFYWRASTAWWWGVVIGGIAYAWLLRSEGGGAVVARWAMRAVVPLGVLLALLAWWLP